MGPVLRILLEFYHDIADPHFVLDEYLKTGGREAARQSVTGVYMKLLEFSFKYRSQKYLNYVKNKSNALVEQPNEVLKFIMANDVDYRPLISTLRESLANQAISSFVPTNFESSAAEQTDSEQDIDGPELYSYLPQWCELRTQ